MHYIEKTRKVIDALLMLTEGLLTTSVMNDCF